MDLWVMILLGLAGPEGSHKHIEESIKMVNVMKPRHMSALTYMPEPGTPMYNDIINGKFTCITPQQALMETRQLIEGLTVEPLHVTANHASNYLPLKGGLPEDKAKFLNLIDQALAGKIGLQKTLNRGI